MQKKHNKKLKAGHIIKIEDTISGWQQGQNKIPAIYMQANRKLHQPSSKNYPNNLDKFKSDLKRKYRNISKSTPFLYINKFNIPQSKNMLIQEEINQNDLNSSECNQKNRSLLLDYKLNPLLRTANMNRKRNNHQGPRLNTSTLDNGLSLSFTLNSFTNSVIQSKINYKIRSSTIDNPTKDKIRQEKESYNIKMSDKKQNSIFLEKLFNLSKQKKKLQQDKPLNKSDVQWQIQRALFLRSNVKFKNWKNSTKKMMSSSSLLSNLCRQ